MKNDYEIRGDVIAIFLDRRDGTRLETLISAVDFDKASSFPTKWHARWNESGKSYYATGNTKNKHGIKSTIQLHRFLLDAPEGLVVDHINHNTLDNTRSNIRVLTIGANNQNKKIQTNSQSGIRGVRFHKKTKKWEARIRLNNKYIFLGYFDSIDEANNAAVAGRKKYHPYSEECI